MLTDWKSSITLKQNSGDHMFSVLQNGKEQDRCDLITAEELAEYYEGIGCRVQWVYPEDKGYYNA